MVELVCEQTSLLLDWSAAIGGLKRNYDTGVQHQRMQFDGFDIDHGKQHAVRPVKHYQLALRIIVSLFHFWAE